MSGWELLKLISCDDAELQAILGAQYTVIMTAFSDQSQPQSNLGPSQSGSGHQADPATRSAASTSVSDVALVEEHPAKRKKM